MFPLFRFSRSEVVLNNPYKLLERMIIGRGGGETNKNQIPIFPVLRFRIILCNNLHTRTIFDRRRYPKTKTHPRSVLRGSCSCDKYFTLIYALYLYFWIFATCGTAAPLHIVGLSMTLTLVELMNKLRWEPHGLVYRHAITGLEHWDWLLTVFLQF